MWFATDDGLHRYDGYKFKIYRPETDNPYSISNVFCLSLYEDVNGNMWIGTYGDGLNMYDPRTGHFTRPVRRSGTKPASSVAATGSRNNSLGGMQRAATFDIRQATLHQK